MIFFSWFVRVEQHPLALNFLMSFSKKQSGWVVLISLFFSFRLPYGKWLSSPDSTCWNTIYSLPFPVLAASTPSPTFCRQWFSSIPCHGIYSVVLPARTPLSCSLSFTATLAQFLLSFLIIPSQVVSIIKLLSIDCSQRGTSAVGAA